DGRTQPVVAPQSLGSTSATDWLNTHARPEKSVALYKRVIRHRAVAQHRLRLPLSERSSNAADQPKFWLGGRSLWGKTGWDRKFWPSGRKLWRKTGWDRKFWPSGRKLWRKTGWNGKF
ncbi:MAG: hypothetical protein L0H41_15830, partial [Microlunatus sp.]|nr:hypothetical protein [Microlunatus sp.]